MTWNKFRHSSFLRASNISFFELKFVYRLLFASPSSFASSSIVVFENPTRRTTFPMAVKNLQGAFKDWISLLQRMSSWESLRASVSFMSCPSPPETMKLESFSAYSWILSSESWRFLSRSIKSLAPWKKSLCRKQK